MANDGICGYLILRQNRVTIFLDRNCGETMGSGPWRKEWHQTLGVAFWNGKKSHVCHRNNKEISKSKRGLAALPYAADEKFIRFVIML